MAEYTDIQLEIEEPAGVITMRRPDKLNAFTDHMLAALQRAIEAAVADPRVVGIVIAGEGRAFSAGLDSQALVDVTTAEANAPGSRSGVPGPDIPGLFTYL